MMLMKISQINLRNRSSWYSIQIIIGTKSTNENFEFKEIDKESQMLNLNKIIQLLKKNKLFTTIEKLITVRTFDLKKGRFFKNYFCLFHL